MIYYRAPQWEDLDHPVITRDGRTVRRTTRSPSNLHAMSCWNAVPNCGVTERSARKAHPLVHSVGKRIYRPVVYWLFIPNLTLSTPVLAKSNRFTATPRNRSMAYGSYWLAEWVFRHNADKVLQRL